MRLLLILSLGAAAAGATRVQDTLFDGRGQRANGTCVIAWPSFVTAGGKAVAGGTRQQRVRNGVLDVVLEPTVGATPANAVYTVRCLWVDGRPAAEEYWAVVDAASPVTVAGVRVAAPPVGAPPGTSIGVGQVTGLQALLDARASKGASYAPLRTAVIDASGNLAGAPGNAADCVKVDGSSGACGTGGGGPAGNFVDGETPAGTLDGVNVTFTLAQMPSPYASLKLYRNGIRLKLGADYTLAGATITFVPAATPQAGDLLLADYRY
jgi:hypothetical protein